MKPTLLILAAGMGSRYGGLKQLDGVGPYGETIMDYSVYDAVNAGFGKVVFVIRQSFEASFRQEILGKYASVIPVEVVFQDVSSLPSGVTCNAKREKPWGTNHAIMMAEHVIDEPFAVINADDFYGKESYTVLANFLRQVDGQSGNYCMVGYRLANTLSENGSVSRGECRVDDGKQLVSITERTNILSVDGVIHYLDEDGKAVVISADTPVSMNMWGFTPDYFAHSNKAFREFLEARGQELKSEFYIPALVNDLIVTKQVTCQVLDTPSQWFGVTYPEDRQGVVFKINQLINSGYYPSKLWQ
jgi:NDP-sugar pyrophosphorylase family protein